MPHEGLTNPQVVLPNGDDFELDLIFLVARAPLWIECKTGSYQQYITKYAEMRKHLGIPIRQAILVILSISDDLAQRLSLLYGITVATPNTFLTRVGEALALGPPAASPAAPLSAATPPPPAPHPLMPPVALGHLPAIPSALSTALNKDGLRPCPEWRATFITTLITVVETLDGPCSLVDLKARLATRLPISKSMLQDLLRAALLGGCFVDEAGERVIFFIESVAGLATRDPDEIEMRCLTVYIRAIRMTFPDFPANAHLAAEFARLVGCAPETLATLATR